MMFKLLEEIHTRPEPYAFYTAADLWTDAHISAQMLRCHLDPDLDMSSRRADFIEQSVAWIGSHFKIGKGTRIADFGCGPGLYTNRLAKLGAAVTGIDFSERSLAHARSVAREERLTATYIHGNYLDFETTERYDIILMIMFDFCVLSPVQRMTMLEKFHDHLAPGGSVLLDVQSQSAYNDRKEATAYAPNLMNGFWSPGKYHGFLTTFKYDDVSVVLDKYTIIEEERKRTIYNWFQYYTPETLQREFKQAGFGHFELHGNVAGAPFDETAPEFTLVARCA